MSARRTKPAPDPRELGRGAADADRLRSADEAARQLAVSEFERPVALEAGAGTGKTRALVSRLATWMLGPGWDAANAELAEEARTRGRKVEPGDVAARVADGTVAITFTEAAAAEMARRLGCLLLEVAAGRSARDLEPLPVRLAGIELAPRARELSASLSRLRVQTIHGFCHALLAEHPFEARLHPNIEVDAEGTRLDEAARAALISRLRERDETLLQLIATGVDPRSIHEAIVALINGGARRSDLAEPRYTAAACEELLDSLVAAVRKFLDLLEPLAAAAKRAQRAGDVARALQRVAAAADEGEAEPIARLARVREELPDLAEEWTSAFADWARGKLNKSEIEFLGAAADAYLAAARDAGERIDFLEQADPSEFESARRALVPLVDETRARLRRAGVLTFDDLLDETITLLADNGSLRRRVRRSIRQLLVDEFQDTDLRQCELLRLLVFADEPPAEERPGLFVVGDPKQSIYAWRNADLAAYQAFVASIVASGGVCGRLAVNFRSAPPILDEVERSVSPSMQYAERLQPAFEPLLPSEANRGAPGFARHERAPVEFWLSWDAEAVASGEAPTAGRAAEIEAAAIAADIADLARRHGEPWKEFAILLRTRGHLELYLDALRRAGVPYAVQNDRSYYRRREVIDLLSLVRCVLDPGDDLARVAALRSPFVGVPDVAWLPLEAARFSAAMRELDGIDESRLAVAREAIARAAAEMPPGAAEIPGLAELADWPAALEAAVESISRLRGEWRVLPVAAWLERLRSRFLVEPVAAARFLGRFGLANVERVFAELEGALAEAADPLAVLATMRRAVEEDAEAEEARPPESELDAVSVLTIHTAKGLEFGHVFVAQAHKEPPARRIEVAAALLRGAPDTPAELELFGVPSPGWLAACAKAERARDAEIVRLLYVALTRARQRLVICGLWNPDAAKRPPARSFVARLALRRPEMLEGIFSPGVAASIADRALWRRLDRIASPPAAPATVAGTAAEGGASIPATDRRAARDRAGRPRFESASAVAGAVEIATLEELAAAIEPAPRLDRAREGALRESAERARARGVALHRALELASRDPEVEAAARAAYLEARPGASTAELEELATDLRALSRSSLWRHLESLAPDIRGRELPMALPATGEPNGGPLDGYLGTIDLLYRDPTSGELVVADFKSDPAPDGGADALAGWVESKVARYGEQLKLYGRAVENALGLPAPPRLELWLLGADRIAVVPAAAGVR